MNCKSCKKFIKTHKKWVEDKVPSTCIVNIFECTDCKKQYEVYKNMLQAVP